MNAGSSFPVSVLDLQFQPDVNPSYHQDAAFQFDLANRLTHQASSRRIDLTRLQRASKGAGKSTGGCRDNIIQRRGVGFGDRGCDLIVLRDCTIDTEDYRFRLNRKPSLPDRPFHALDANFGTISDFRHDSPPDLISIASLRSMRFGRRG
jgi:hypothetical protein